MSAHMPTPLADYLPALLAGDAGAIRRLFGDAPQIDDQRQGRIVGEAALQRFVAESAAYFGAFAPTIAALAPLVTPQRTVIEAELALTVAGVARSLPLAIVGESDGAGRLRALRTYHSTWPLTGTHRVRPPILPTDPDLILPPIVARYMDALAVADAAALTAMFDEEGSVREPSGGAYLHRGPAARRAFYEQIAAIGDLPLAFAALADDGVRCAVEYNVVAWGAIRPQAGIAIYERATDALLAAVRIYDDLAVEEMPAAGD